jgi:hypothetical protein
MTTTSPDRSTGIPADPACTCPTFDGEQAISVACPVHDTPADKPDEASAVDPDAINLEVIKEYRGVDQIFFTAAISDLIAAVEALRERVVVADGNIKCLVEANKHWHLRVSQMTTDAEATEARGMELQAGAREATAKRPTWQCCDPWFDGLLGGLLRRAKAAEAREVELAGALEWALDIIDINDKLIAEKLGVQCDQQIDQVAKTKARSALAATPAKALERARAVEAEGYAAGLEAAAKVADQHRGSAAKARLAKDQPLGMMDDDGLVVEIRAEERGEDIAAEIIAKAIRALGKEEG